MTSRRRSPNLAGNRPTLGDLPDLPLLLMLDQLDLQDLIKCRLISKRFKILVDQIKLDELLIASKYYNTKSRCKSTVFYTNWMMTNELVSNGYSSYNLKLKFFNSPSFKNKFENSLSKLYLNTKELPSQFQLIEKFRNSLKQLKCHFFSRLNRELRLPNLQSLEINLEPFSRLRLNAPNLKKIYCLSCLASLELEHPQSVDFIRLLSTKNHKLPNLSRFTNVEVFQYLDCVNLSSFMRNYLNQLNVFQFEKLREFHYIIVTSLKSKRRLDNHRRFPNIFVHEPDPLFAEDDAIDDDALFNRLIDEDGLMDELNFLNDRINQLGNNVNRINDMNLLINPVNPPDRNNPVNQPNGNPPNGNPPNDNPPNGNPLNDNARRPGFADLRNEMGNEMNAVRVLDAALANLNPLPPPAANNLNLNDLMQQILPAGIPAQRFIFGPVIVPGNQPVNLQGNRRLFPVRDRLNNPPQVPQAVDVQAANGPAANAPAANAPANAPPANLPNPAVHRPMIFHAPLGQLNDPLLVNLFQQFRNNRENGPTRIVDKISNFIRRTLDTKDELKRNNLSVFFLGINLRNKRFFDSLKFDLENTIALQYENFPHLADQITYYNKIDYVKFANRFNESLLDEFFCKFGNILTVKADKIPKPELFLLFLRRCKNLSSLSIEYDHKHQIIYDQLPHVCRSLKKLKLTGSEIFEKSLDHSFLARLGVWQINAGQFSFDLVLDTFKESQNLKLCKFTYYKKQVKVAKTNVDLYYLEAALPESPGAAVPNKENKFALQKKDVAFSELKRWCDFLKYELVY